MKTHEELKAIFDAAEETAAVEDGTLGRLAVFEAGLREGATGMQNRAAMIADGLAERAGAASTRARAATVIAAAIRALPTETGTPNA